MADRPSDDLSAARERIARYDAANVVRKAALKIAKLAPDQVDHERLRRHRLGLEGRIAEDIVRLVEACEPVWELLAIKGLPGDVSIRELRRIREAVLGRQATTASLPRISLRFHADEVNVAAVRNLIPELHESYQVDGYRYAAWTDPSTRAVEPFIVLLTRRAQDEHRVLATMFAGSTFLRYEQELGSVDRAQLVRVSRAISADLQLTAETHAALLSA